MYIVSSCISTILCWGYLGTERYGTIFKRAKDLPQHKYLSRPIYKWVASRSNIVVATVATFIISDLVMHQATSNISRCIFSKFHNPAEMCTFIYSPLSTLFWMVIGTPVIYAKYKILSAQTANKRTMN